MYTCSPPCPPSRHGPQNTLHLLSQPEWLEGQLMDHPRLGCISTLHPQTLPMAPAPGTEPPAPPGGEPRTVCRAVLGQNGRGRR